MTASTQPSRPRWTIGPRSVGGRAYVYSVLGSPEIYPLGIPLAGAVIVPILFPERATLSFYEIAASVIPLFFIVLAIDARMFRLRRLPTPSPEPSHSERVRFLIAQIRQNFVFILLANLGAGEYTALHTVAIGKAAAGQTYGPVSALTVGFLGTAVVATRRGAARLADGPLRVRDEPLVQCHVAASAAVGLDSDPGLNGPNAPSITCVRSSISCSSRDGSDGPSRGRRARTGRFSGRRCDHERRPGSDVERSRASGATPKRAAMACVAPIGGLAGGGTTRRTFREPANIDQRMLAVELEQLEAVSFIARTVVVGNDYLKLRSGALAEQ